MRDVSKECVSVKFWQTALIALAFICTIGLSKAQAQNICYGTQQEINSRWDLAYNCRFSFTSNSAVFVEVGVFKERKSGSLYAREDRSILQCFDIPGTHSCTSDSSCLVDPAVRAGRHPSGLRLHYRVGYGYKYSREIRIFDPNNKRSRALLRGLRAKRWVRGQCTKR